MTSPEPPVTAPHTLAIKRGFGHVHQCTVMPNRYLQVTLERVVHSSGFKPPLMTAALCI